MKYQYWDVLPKYMEWGWIKKTDHPSLPISIYGYTRTCQFESRWDDVTRDCRGIILDNEGNLIARGFPKFYNWEETDLSIPKHEHVHIQSKADGSLGILFYYSDQWMLATRGSFASEQAAEGMEIISNSYDLNKFHKDLVYVGEIIYPENRIVVDYGDAKKFIFLSVFVGDSELNWTTALGIFHSSGIPEEDIIQTEMVTEIEQIVKKLRRQEDEIANEEGFVFRFHPDNYRVKLKFNDYVRLHRLLTGFSNLDIWRSLSEGNGVIEFLDRVPDEFDKWVRSQVSHLQEQYDETQRTCRYLMKENFAISKKDFAEKIKNLDSNLKPIVFAMYDQKEYSKMIWKNLRPVYQKPFWQKDED